MKEEYEKDNNELNDSTDDVLSMLQGNTEGEQEDGSDFNSSADDLDKINQSNEMEDTDEDLLALLDMISAQDEKNTNHTEEQPYYSETPKKDNFPDVQSIDDDIMDMNELRDAESNNLNSNANDMSGIFSDVLSAVDTLEDEADLSSVNLEPTVSTKNKKILEEINKDFFNEAETKKDKNIIQKIFGKKDKNQDIKHENSKKAETKGNKSLKATEDIKKEKQNIKDGASKDKEKNVLIEKQKIDKRKKQAEKLAKKKADKKEAQKKKAEKLEAKKERIKINNNKKAQLVEDVEVNADSDVKLNKLAVIFVMTFCILVGGFVLIGTNLYSYSLGIKNANFNFERQRYTEAYKEVYGLDIKKKDKETYDKIMTVMFVNKQLSSYKNYYSMNKYPEALDSLLKGLERYDKYIDYAIELDIKSDMDYIKEQILTELDKAFHISEEEAIALNNKEDQSQYSINVINTVLENMN